MALSVLRDASEHSCWGLATSTGVLALLAALTLSQPTPYAIDPAETELVALTTSAGWLSGASHPHVIVARQVVGEIAYDPEAPETASITVSFRADDLENDDPRMRERFRLKSTISSEDRRTIGANMRAPNQLDVKRFPTVSFTSKKVTRLAANRLEVVGTMALHGIAVELALPVTVSVKDGVLQGKGTVAITHSMFGLKPFSTALGAVGNAEEITLDLRLTGRSTPLKDRTGALEKPRSAPGTSPL